MHGKAQQLLVALIVALPLAGCASGLDTSTSATLSSDNANSNGLSVSVGPGIAPVGLTYGTPYATSAVQVPSGMTVRPGDAFPFVRNQPATVAPFPLVLNQTVQRYVDGYLSQPQGIEASFRRSNPYMAEMVAVLQNQGLPKDLVYLTFAESAFSDDGAGPWQLSRDTARRYGLSINSWVDERRDPIKSTRAAAAYLATLHDQVDADWRMTLVAWNNGESGVSRYRHLRDASYDLLVRRLPSRTRELLNRFMAVAMIARHSHELGIREAEYTPSPSYQVVAVKGGTSLKTLAERVRSSVWMLRLLNPGLLRDTVPPTGSYSVRIPAGSENITADAL